MRGHSPAPYMPAFTQGFTGTPRTGLGETGPSCPHCPPGPQRCRMVSPAPAASFPSPSHTRPPAVSHYPTLGAAQTLTPGLCTLPSLCLQHSAPGPLLREAFPGWVSSFLWYFGPSGKGSPPSQTCSTARAECGGLRKYLQHQTGPRRHPHPHRPPHGGGCPVAQLLALSGARRGRFQKKG